MLKNIFIFAVLCYYFANLPTVYFQQIALCYIFNV